MANFSHKVEVPQKVQEESQGLHFFLIDCNPYKAGDYDKGMKLQEKGEKEEKYTGNLNKNSTQEDGYQSFKRQPHNMVKRTQKIRRQYPTLDIRQSSAKKLFRKLSQNSQDRTSDGTLFQ